MKTKRWVTACKEELLSLYGQFPAGEISLSTTEGGIPLEPDDLLPAQNTRNTPVYINVFSEVEEPPRNKRAKSTPLEFAA